MRRRSAMIAAAAFVLLWLPHSIARGQSDVEAARAARKEQIRQCRALLKQTLAVVDSGAYDSALAILREAGKCDPKNADVFYHSGRLQLRLGDTTTAVATLADGVATAPLSRRLKLLLARTKIALGAHDEAVALIDAVLAIKPNEGEALYLKGLVLHAAGDAAEAVDLWQRALELALARESR